MSSVWDRRNRRISYQVPVGVVDLQAQRVLNMSSINVSRGGIFVDTEENLTIGAPVVCNLPYGRDEAAMQLRGRVAWLRPKSSSTPNRPGGVGIEFVDLSDDESDKLSDIVGQNEEESHQLSLKLPGLADPVRGQAFLTPQGVFFRSKLPFLALESDVEFVFEDEDDDLVYDGKIVGVDVYNDPGSAIPRLQVEIAVRAGDLPDSLDIPLGEGSGHEYEVLHVDAADTEKTVAPSKNLVIEIPQMMPIVMAPVPSAAVVRDEVLVEFTERVSPAAKRFAQLWPPAALLVGCIVGILAFALAGGDDDKSAVNGATLPDNATEQISTGSLTPIRDAEIRARKKSSEAEAALSRIRAAALDEEEELGDLHEETPSAANAPVPARASALANAPAPAKAPAPVAANKAFSATRSMAGEGLQESIAGAKIWESEGKLVIRVPIDGNLERATDYRLADPPGIAINLPYAQPTGGFHSSVSPQNDKVRSLWVRERLGGLHIRAFFHDTAESCDVKYGASAVVIRCGF